MSGSLSSVAYKKGNLMRYALWVLATVCVGLLIYTFVSAMSGEFSTPVPDGYKFIITDNYGKNRQNHTKYYIYDDKILVETENYNDGESSYDHSAVIYDNVNTSGLSYQSEDDAEDCEMQDSCTAKAKALTDIRRLISGKPGREYIGR